MMLMTMRGDGNHRDGGGVGGYSSVVVAAAAAAALLVPRAKSSKNMSTGLHLFWSRMRMRFSTPLSLAFRRKSAMMMNSYGPWVAAAVVVTVVVGLMAGLVGLAPMGVAGRRRGRTGRRCGAAGG